MLFRVHIDLLHGSCIPLDIIISFVSHCYINSPVYMFESFMYSYWMDHVHVTWINVAYIVL